MGIDYTPTIIRSDRKTLSLQVYPDGRVIVRAPRRVSKEQIDAFLAQKQTWLESHLAKVRAAQEEQLPPFTAEEIRTMADRALVLLPPLAAKYAPIVGVTYGRITIRNQRSRWGSCSGKGNLNFNCLLALCPQSVTEYLVVHELCHRLQMNHLAAFWREVARVDPDYKEAEAWLKSEGSKLMRRMRSAAAGNDE